MEPSDTSLLEACQRGDAAAWEMLVTRYQRLIFSIPRRSGLGPDLCADVFQQVFMSLVTHLDRIEQPERLAAWLVTAARRETWRVSRRDKATQSFENAEAQDETDTLPDTAPLPGEVLLELETQHTVRTAVNSLDDRCRILLTMLFYSTEPPAYADIAATLQISTGSIGPTRARCLQKLRRLLETVEE